LVFNAAGQLFLQRRSLTKDCSPGRWDSSASGHLDSGEEYDAAAVRELREELGWVAAEAPVRLFKLSACAATGMEFVWVYRMTAQGPFVLHPEEIAAGDWFTAAEVRRWTIERPDDFASSFLRIWCELEKRGLVGGRTSRLNSSSPD
jgi:isopentenyldiphosphate isomerase